MDKAGRVAAFALLALGISVGLALPFAACARGSSSAVLDGSLRIGYAVGHVVCHQRPDRSFFSCGQQWPVCGRCAGLYMGFALGGLVGLVAIVSRPRPAIDDATSRWRRALALAAVPTAILWLVEFGAGVNPGSVARWAGALPLGVTAALWIAAIGRGDLR